MDIPEDDMPPRTQKPAVPPPDDETAQLLVYMPIIARAGGISDWDRNFAISVAGRMKRGPVRPTEKQIGVMRRIVAKFKDATIRDGPDVVGR